MSNASSLAELRDQSRIAYECGNLDTALHLINACLQVDSGDPHTCELNGLIQYSLEHYQASVSSLEAASLVVPLRPAARVCLAYAYSRIGRLGLSCDLLRELINDPQLSVELLLQVATGLDQLDRPDLSVQACRRVLSLAPAVAQAHYDMGYYIGRCGGPNDAVEVFARQAIELDPVKIKYRVGLAGLLLRREQTEEALELVRDLSKTDIESITCVCCLRRVVELYEHSRDIRRVIIGRQRLLFLESHNSPKESC